MAKAFDCTSRHVLYSELSRYGFDMKSIIALKTIYSKVRLSVKTNKELSEPFATQRGFPQGRPASSLAWSVVYDPVLDDLCRSGLAFCITAGNWAIFVFADDTLVICNDPAALQALISLIRWLIRRIEMRANVGKSAVMIWSCNKYLKKRLKKNIVFYWGRT